MRRVAMFLCIGALLLGSMISSQAQQIAIAGDNNNLMDISLRDADLAQALTALFSTTGGKKQLKMNDGVNGRITRLQLTQTPFDNALDAMLGTDYSYRVSNMDNGIDLYTIYGRSGSSTVYTPKMPTFQAPSIGTPSFGDATGAPAATTWGGAGTGASTSPSLLSWGNVGSTTGTDSTTAGTDAASETSVVKLIRVMNIDVMMLSDYLGGTSVDLFALLNSGNGNGNGNGGSNGGYNNNNGGYNNNNNGYNNNYNNNNNNNRYNNNNRNNNNNNNNNRNNRNNNRNNNNNGYYDSNGNWTNN